MREPQGFDHDEARVQALRTVLLDEEGWPLGMRSRVEARLAREARQERRLSQAFLAIAGTFAFIGGTAVSGFDRATLGAVLCAAIAAALYSTGLRFLAARESVE